MRTFLSRLSLSFRTTLSGLWGRPSRGTKAMPKHAPGVVCMFKADPARFPRDSQYNGRIVVLDRPIPIGTQIGLGITNSPWWHFTPIWENNIGAAREEVLFPLDNPPDDAEDEMVKIVNLHTEKA